jgi:hypothetical protein
MFNPFNDDEDVFGFNLTPKEKFYQILHTMNKDVVQNELNEVFKKVAMLDMLFSEEEIEEKLRMCEFEKEKDFENSLQGLYIDVMAKMLGQHE